MRCAPPSSPRSTGGAGGASPSPQLADPPQSSREWDGAWACGGEHINPSRIVRLFRLSQPIPSDWTLARERGCPLWGSVPPWMPDHPIRGRSYYGGGVKGPSKAVGAGFKMAPRCEKPGFGSSNSVSQSSPVTCIQICSSLLSEPCRHNVKALCITIHV